MPWGFKVVMTERWAVSPQLHLAALVVWRVVEHRPALVSKCCWLASAMSPGVVSCQKRDAERWDLCSSLKCHVNLWSAATVLYLVGFLTSLTSGMLLRWEQATVLPTSGAGWESWEMETHGLCAGGCSEWASPCWPGHLCQQGTCLSLPRSYCYHHIAHVSSHLLENLSQIRNEVTLTHPVSCVSQEPSRQRARFSPEQLCAIWILLLSFLWLKITLPQGTPVPEGLQGVLLGMSGECWQRVKTSSSCGSGDLHRKMWV